MPPEIATMITPASIAAKTAKTVARMLPAISNETVADVPIIAFCIKFTIPSPIVINKSNTGDNKLPPVIED